MKPDSCYLCGGNMTLVRDRADFRVGRRSTVVEVERFRCGDCGETLSSPEQMDAAQVAASDELRRQDGLLTPSEIRGIRESCGLTQSQMEQLLGVGPKTVVRWERGTVFQNQATDQLLRVISAVPEAIEYLARRNGVPMSPTNSTIVEAPARSRRHELSARSIGQVVPWRDFLEKSQQLTAFRSQWKLPLAEISIEEVR